MNHTYREVRWRIVFCACFLVLEAAAVGAPQQFQAASESALYDASKWTVVKRVRTDFGPELKNCEVLLLRFLKPTDESGGGEPMYDVQLLITNAGGIVYDYRKERLKTDTRHDPGLFLNDMLRIRDVTSDGVPQVIFHSGSRGASDFSQLNHILRYDKSMRRFVDIGPSDFNESGEAQLRWTTVGRRAVAVVADRDWKRWEAESSAPEDMCHVCKSPYLYSAYRWDRARKSFIRYRTLRGRKKFEDGYEALKADWAYIKAKLASPPK